MDSLASLATLSTINLTILAHLSTAILAGALIGLERGFRGRAAGFRTHTLVCLASSLLMLVTLYQDEWMVGAIPGTIRMDPTRMAQGIMTGIGFLGAGVIFKDGLTVRGLTTAASVWITAAIGILFGVGFYFPAIVTTLATLGILSMFRWIENQVPSRSYALLHLRFCREDVWAEEKVRNFLKEDGFSVSGISYSLIGNGDNGEEFEYRMTISTLNFANYGQLATALAHTAAVREFKLLPRDD